MPTNQMRQLWKSISELFFGVDIGDAKFVWSREIYEIGMTSVLTNTDGRCVSCITMNLDKTTKDCGNYHVVAIISTLLHEAVHSFLAKYRCESCRTENFTTTGAYHGRPFQIIAAKIEEIVPRLLDIPVKLGRDSSLLQLCGEVQHHLSRHDIVVFRLSSVQRAPEEAGDIAELIARTRALHDYLPRKQLRSMWYKGQALVGAEGYSENFQRIETRSA